MSYDLSKLLVIGISSRALFDLAEENRIFETQGLQAFIDYQHKHEDIVLRPGCAFQLVKGFLELNNGPKGRRVEVVLMSRNHPDVSLRVFNSIDHYKLQISRAALTGGAPLGPYLAAFNVGLLLSQSVEDVQSAANQGIAAGLIYPPPPPEVPTTTGQAQIRIALDVDGVIVSDQGQRVYEQHGIEAFYEHEKNNARKELPAGPFAKVLRVLSEIQGAEPEKSPVRIALVTDRDMPAHERVILTLRAWNVRVDEALFLGGIEKTEFLKAFGAHMFFDDKEEYCKRASAQVPTGLVLPPTPEPALIQTTVSLAGATDDGAQKRFLVICKNYLKRAFPQSEVQLSNWYKLNVLDWSGDSRSRFLDELETSVEGTPRGHERRADKEEDSDEAKLFSFLENLRSKHRPK